MSDYEIFWVRHADSCANTLINHDPNWFDNIEKNSLEHSHPTLSGLGIDQSILLGKNYFNLKDKNFFTNGFSSPLARTIMTALLSMRTYALKNEDFKIFINPYISEKITEIGSLDYANKIMSPRKLKLIITIIKNWLSDYWLIEYNDIEFFEIINDIKEKNDSKNNEIIENFMKNINNTLKPYDLKNMVETFINDLNIDHHHEIKKFLDPNFLRGPNISFEYYNESLYDFTLKPNFYKKEGTSFITYYNQFYDNIGDGKFVCFSHGNILSSIINKNNSNLKNSVITTPTGKKIIRNTAVIHENIKDMFFDAYPLETNLKELEENRNFHISNKNNEIKMCFDGCTLNNLIKKIAFYPDDIINNILPLSNNTPIVKIFEKYDSTDKMAKFFKRADAQLEFRKKYFKYKKKYLSLRK